MLCKSCCYHGTADISSITVLNLKIVKRNKAPVSLAKTKGTGVSVYELNKLYE